MKPAYKNIWLTGLLLLSGFCTIRDDNGQPGISGPDKIEDTTENLALSVSAESTYVRLNDTITILARVYSDSTENGSVIPLKTYGFRPVPITANLQRRYSIRMRTDGQNFFSPTLFPEKLRLRLEQAMRQGHCALRLPIHPIKFKNSLKPYRKDR